MKFMDIVHGLDNRGARESRGLYRVRSFATPGGVVVLLTDLGDKNTGPSITNAVENVIDSLQAQGFVLAPATFIEHYEKGGYSGESFDLISILPTRWTRLDRDEVLGLIGDQSLELDDNSLENPRIIELADIKRFRFDPFVDSPYPKSNDFIVRKMSIMESMVTKASVSDLVQAGSGERDLQSLLKTDLSIFGEVYAKPDEEYICFSEFPLADGFVDFVVLTGRSRMDVILIEIKGADFNLANANHYGAFNHKVAEAATQIKQRLGVVYRNLEAFRLHAHGLRHRAEVGESVYNAFLGPRVPLQVDPDKDINVRSIVIGGRTVRDHEESVKRQDYEVGSTPPVRIESWDTWLRRLQRS